MAYGIDDEKELETYRWFMGAVATKYAVTMDSDGVKEGLELMYNWSHAHRAGNGELSDEEQDAMVLSVIEKMREYANQSPL